MDAYERYLDRMLDLHQGRDLPLPGYRVLTSGAYQGWGYVETSYSGNTASSVTVLAEDIDELPSAQHLARQLCVTYRRDVWVETEGEDPESKGYYEFNADDGQAYLNEQTKG